MRRRALFRTTAITLVLALTLSVFGQGQVAAPVQAAAAGKTAAGTAAPVTVASERLQTNYTHVSAGYKARPYNGAALSYSPADCVESGRNFLEETDTRSYGAPVLKVGTGDRVVLRIDVPETALYFIGFDYLSYDESILPVEMGMKLDGEYSFYEMRNVKLETTWVSDDEPDVDRYGNQIVTMPEKLVRWEHKDLSDPGHRYSRPLSVQLTAGSHELELTVSEGHFLLGNITLEAPEQIAEKKTFARAEGSELITIEAEQFTERNDSSVHAVGEYDSAITPTYVRKTLLNTVDEDSFSDPGQKITYEFNVEKAGYYNIALNYRQSEKNGFPVFVNYEIDGQIPSADFLNYPMEYAAEYETVRLKSQSGEDMSVLLDSGRHTISLTISADPIRYALEAVDEMISGISDLSLEVTKVAGTNKAGNRYRDLKITRYITDIEDRLYGWVDRLYEITAQAEGFVDADDPEEVAAFSYLLIAAKQLETLAEEPEELVYRVAELSTSSNSINTQLANFVDLINRNNMAVDRIYICQEDAELPHGAGFFRSIWLAVCRFFYSFFGQSYSSSNTDPSHIQVWVNRPRQYVEIMQKMIDDEFTPSTGIEIDLSLMTDAQKLILSNASGDTPDIATGMNYSIPFELGIRGALVDLSRFDNYKEVFGRYSDGLLVPSVIGDGLYSLPETMNFYVLFYRSDILSKLGLAVPDTMDDLIAMLPDLQMRGLNVFYPTAGLIAMRHYHGTTPLIFQNGGRLYGETAMDLMLDSEETIAGFTQLTELFTLYDMPYEVPNFYQHFRNGDLALGIADFNSYNLILNAAPEIANSWGIALVPGVRDKETGEIRRYMSGGAEATVMFTSDDEREQKAWTFMDWWSSTGVQAEFGQMIQIMYGDEYIWPTANLEAFELLPYPSSDKAVIMEQAEQILEAPRLLGSYMLERELSNAFVDIVANHATLRSRMDDAVKTVNRETMRKLEEFKYIDSEGNVLKPYYIPSVERVRMIMSR